MNGNNVRRDLKEHGVTISISTVATTIPLFAALWFVIKPVIVEQVSAEVSTEMQDKVKEGVRPINGAFKAIIRADINALRKEIAALEFKRDNRPDDWTAEDANELADKRISLDALREALTALN